MDKEHAGVGYITQPEFNQVIYELKSDIKEVDNKYDKKLIHMERDNQQLTFILEQLNKNIENNNKIMNNLDKRFSNMEESYQTMREENIRRDHSIEKLEEFKISTDSLLSRKRKELGVFYAAIASGAATVIVAIINVAQGFF